MEPFSLGILIREQVEVLQRLSRNHLLEIETDEDLAVIADRKLIGQAITNLLTNAVRYSPKAVGLSWR